MYISLRVVLVRCYFGKSNFTNSGKDLFKVDLCFTDFWQILPRHLSGTALEQFGKFLPEFEKVDFQKICGTSTTYGMEMS